ncbi:MAG: hypothetical protein AAFQ89_01120 [Cyanobacteria bacterium J06626_18]
MQPLPPKLLSLAILPLLIEATVADAQPAPEGESTSTDVLVVQPRGSAGYSTSGGGFDGFGYIDGFVPLFQTPARDLWYLQGRGRLDNQGDLSGTLLFGYRYYDAAGDQVWGGYVGYDGRATDDNYFNQVGFGLELLGDVEVRLNGYLPVGNTRQLSDSSSTSINTPGDTITATTFSENSLLLGLSSGTLTTQMVQEFEAAVGGVDLEIGTRLADWEQGDLRGYAGLYYQDPAGAEGVVGGRARLEAQPIPELNLGLSVSSDGLFGTNVTFQVGATFGGAPQSEATEDSNVVLLGELVKRQSTLIIDHQTEVDIVKLDTPSQVVAINPATNQPWRFVHVTGGLTGGSGTAANPFGQVTNAVADIEANSSGTGDDIIYVQAGTNPGLEGFAVPDTVQVLSSGPLQAVDTVQQGLVTLPESDNSVLPIVNGTPSGITAFDVDAMVSLGNSTTLSGFDVQGGDSYGLLIQDASDATVVDNRLSTTGDAVDGVVILANSLDTDDVTLTNNAVATTGESASGILLRSTGSTINNTLLEDNRIETTGFDGEGVFIRASDGAISTTTVVNNDVNTTGEDAQGVLVETNGGEVNTIAIEENRIETEGINGEGIFVNASEGNIDTVVLANNNVRTGGGDAQGIAVEADNAEVSTIRIEGNDVSTEGEDGEGILVVTIASDANPNPGGTLNDVTVAGNRIDTVGEDAQGIGVQANGGDINEMAIANNTITTTENSSEGILVRASAGSVADTTIADNIVSTSGNGSDGIVLATEVFDANGEKIVGADGGNLSDTVVVGNVIDTTGNDANSLFVFVETGDINNTSIADNALTSAGNNADGIQIQNSGTDSERVCIALSDNTVPTVGFGSFGVEFSNSAGNPTLFQVVDQATLLTDNLFVSAAPLNIETSDNFETVSVCP